MLICFLVDKVLKKIYCGSWAKASLADFLPGVLGDSSLIGEVMSKIDIARALKDPTYFNTLTEAEKAEVKAANPAGEASVTDDDLDSVSGGLGGKDSAAAATGTGTDATLISGSRGSASLADSNCNCNC